MITIVSKAEVRDENIEKYLDLVTELADKSRKEPGCISYSLYTDINCPNILTLIEEWEDRSAIEAHNSSEHFVRIVPQLRTLRESSELNLYTKIK